MTGVLGLLLLLSSMCVRVEGGVVDLTDATFDDLVQPNNPVNQQVWFVEFYAVRAPCHVNSTGVRG
jgi:hypothetical protein